MTPSSRSGFNMVEVLVALVLVGIVTITMVSFVNDHHQRYRVAVARSDLMRLAEAMQLAEQRSGKRIERLSEPAGGITSGLAPYILDLPATDPWGNRFQKDPATGKRFTLSLDSGDPYAVDVGMGRIICAGPDGDITTPLGQDPPDSDNDMVVDFRRRPWIVYSVAGAITLGTADGAMKAPVPPVTSGAPPVLANVAISPEGSWFAAIKDGNTLVVGPVDETSSTLRNVIPRNTDPAKGRVQPEIAVTVSADVFPLFYPNGSSLLFVAGRDLYRYDIGMDLVIPLTTGGAFGGADQASGQRTRVSSPRGSSYSFTGGGTSYSIAISVDGKLAVNRPGDTASGIYLVSASGGDIKMLKNSTTNNGLLPVSWVGADNLIYMSNPASGSEKFFYKIRMDGKDEGIALHAKAIPTAITLPTLSTDGTTIAFFSSETEGALLKTDGSGFVEETSDKLFRPFSYSSGIQSTVAPVWSRDSKLVYFVARDGSILQLKNSKQAQGGYFVEQLRANPQGGTGLKPIALELNADETLFALVSQTPPGMYVLPVLGPNGARTELKTPAPAAGEAPGLRWMDRQ
jgi:prepilin-type N-terminal cleavage/methylation domain-containing protein